MDSLIVNDPSSAKIPKDDGQRVRFLCSFSGSIMPRPRDGKLRYVGGETRIMSAPRNITYNELMEKMKELFEGAAVMKYQQSDEDLDALVSVVNDDDLTIMLEEYDKLGSGDGFTRLRIFLFASPDQDISVIFGHGDERDNERRYTDALNSLNESPDFGRHHGESLAAGFLNDVSASEQYLNQISGDSSPAFRRNLELPMAQMNLSHLTIPRRGSGQFQQAVSHKYNEMEAPWSPAYYSPRHPVAVDQRLVSEGHASPSSSFYHIPYGDYVDKNFDSVGEGNLPPVEQQPPYADNVVLLPTGGVVNLTHNHDPGSSSYEANNICENCQTRFRRHQVYPSSYQRSGEQPNLDAPNSCVECPPGRELFVLNSAANIYCRENSDNRHIYTETHPQGWTSLHQQVPLFEEPRAHLSAAGRVMDGYIVDNGMKFPVGHENEPALAPGSQVSQLHVEERGVRYGNFPPQTVGRNAHGLSQGTYSYETAIPPQLVNRPVPMKFTKGNSDDSPCGVTAPENLNSCVESSQGVMGCDFAAMPEYSHAQEVKLVSNALVLENPMEYVHLGGALVEPALSNDPLTTTNRSSLVDGVSVAVAAYTLDSQKDSETSKTFKVNESSFDDDTCLRNGQEATGVSGVCGTTDRNPEFSDVPINVAMAANLDEGMGALQNLPENQLEFLPELIASAKEAALKSLKDIKAEVREDNELSNEHEDNSRDDARIHGEYGHDELEADSDNETATPRNIELMKAEAEAIDRGLQTIKNEDLEEIRELGTGTYGSVYHGKWRGSDVAIKRIKPSCFAGRPSERERLYADFWKEAVLLFSLHHPNVVSFYGVVRDGPDGSLATVTEFMVNGSLKQYLRKKDRTIDRRKRLLIAMDAAFGMEYLHGKNVVHFDLKCENLLVNIRDPHRPVCKIGDLGLSKVKQHTLVSGGVRGTLPWMAPELLSGKTNMVTEKIDVYSFGIVMWELLTGDDPYADTHCAAIIGGIVNGTLRPEIPTWCDPEWKALMERCWSSDPSQRPSFSEISQTLRTMASAMNPK